MFVQVTSNQTDSNRVIQESGGSPTLFLVSLHLEKFPHHRTALITSRLLLFTFHRFALAGRHWEQQKYVAAIRIVAGLLQT